MTIPYTMEEIPPLPEPEGSALKAQLTQCLACLALSPQPINDLDKVPDLPRPHTDSIHGNRSNIIYGNDMDSIDIAVRSALVKFFCSENVLYGFTEYTRVIRLYPRPVVTFQKEAFLKSRPEQSSFLPELSATQAVEFFAEWIVNPDNVVFKKVLGNILDPRIIGDKPRWYSHYVQPFYYQVHNPHSRLGFDLYEDSDSDDDDDDDQFPSTIHEEGGDYSDCGDENCSCCSSFDDSEDSYASQTYAAQQTSEEDFFNSKIHSLYDRSYSSILTEAETAELHKSILADSVYNAPAYRAELDIDANALSNPSSVVGTSLEGGASERDLDSLSEVSEETTSSSEANNKEQPKYNPASRSSLTSRRWSHLIGSIKPKLQSRLSTDSVSSNVSVTSLLSTQTERLAKPSPLLSTKWNSDRTLEIRSQPSSNESSLLKSSLSLDGNVYNSENQQLITEVVGYVKSGDGVGWLSTKRLRRVVMHEGLRQYLINQLDIVHKSNHNILHDVHISRNVYRGYLELMKLIVEGYEHSIKVHGMGGMNSLVLFFELAHRYYCGKKYEDDSTKITSPLLKKSASIDDIKESTVKIESNYDKDSDSSLHYHRELGDVLARQGGKHVPVTSQTSSVSGNDGSDGVEPPVLSHSTLTVTKSGTPIIKKIENENENESESTKKTYLVTKSNCSNGYRFFLGKAIKSVLEPPGRGVSGTGRRYLFEGLQRHRSPIYDNMDFWDAFFLDSVAAEREAAGMDINPVELLNRYKSLGNREKQLLEEDEDALLVVLLHNLVAFMLCMGVEKKQIKMKVRRLLARAHVGLTQTQWVDKVLDAIGSLDGNDIDLLVPRSRQMKVQIFVVHLGDSQTGVVFFLEVREDCIVLKSTNGSIVERWWYENIVNLSCSPKTKVLCVWIRCGEETDLQKICTKKCKNLYNSIKESMKKAAERLDKSGAGMNLGGTFTVVDSYTGQQGILKVSLDGVTVLFVDKKANEICYAILCLFSYIAAAKNTLATHSTTSSSDHGTVS